MTDYKPGTVAIATVHGIPNVRVVRSDSRVWFTAEPVEVDGLGEYDHDDNDVTDIRPLVVLDLDDPAAAVEYLRVATDGFDKAAYGMEAWSGREPLRQIAKQIEAQTKPPRIPEPGLWGVVEAHTVGNPERRRFGRTKTDTWVPEQTAAGYGWDELIDPTLIREGVQA